MVPNDEAYPSVWPPEPIMVFTIPNSSVVTVIFSWYSINEVASKIVNSKQMFLFAKGALALLYPGIVSPVGL